MAISTKIIEGSPMGPISTVLIMRWNKQKCRRFENEPMNNQLFLINRLAQPTFSESDSGSMGGDGESVA
jgi:hypothetical protein